MSKHKPGERVIAIVSHDEEAVQLLGHGTYRGYQEVPNSGIPGWQNPCIELDSGHTVWGYQCWWGDEDTMTLMLGDRRIEQVDVGAYLREAGIEP